MVLCAAYGCNSRPGVDKVSFFRFPKDVGLRRIWIQRLNRGESTTKSLAPNSHHRLCSKHFDDSSFILSPKFAQEIGYGENFILRLKEDAVPTIFVDAEGREKRPAPAERRSASAILEKKRKLHLKSSLYVDNPFNDVTQPLPESSDDFLDSDTFTAKLLSSTLSSTTVRNSTISYQDPPLLSANTTWTSTTTVTASTASTHDSCQTVPSSSCPLSWFADVTLTLPKIQPSSTITEPASSTQQKESEPATKQKVSESTTCTHQKESESSTRQKEVFSIQCQTPHNLISKRSVMIQNSPVMVDKSVQTKCKSKIHMPQREPHLEVSLDESLVSVRSNDPRDPEWTPDHLDDSISDYEDEIDSNSCENEENEASEKNL